MRVLASFFLVGLLLLCSPLRSVDVSAQAVLTTVQDEPKTEQHPRIAPAFSLPDLRGKKTKSSDLQDSVVVLDFWATWCMPCVGEIPTFNQLQEKYSRQGVKVIGLAVQSGWARDIKRFAAKYNMRYAILVGTDDTVGDFDVIGFPTTYVIAPGWKVFKKYSGTYPEKGEDIERDIKTLLTKSVSTKE
jgi:thiol-disulfide isomerase/thioredoxin